MIKAVIIENEQKNTSLLTSLLYQNCSDLVTIEGYATGIRDASLLIKEKKPHLLYLDTELKKGNAFELLDSMGQYDFQVIFTTAVHDYAVKAFRYNAVDYLLKPIAPQELRQATERAYRRCSNTGNNDQVMEVIRELKTHFTLSKVGLPVIDGVAFVAISDIVKAEASGSYSIIYLNNGKKITSTKTLKDIESMLPETSFLRVHNSWMVHIKYLKKYYRGKNSYMEMEDGSTVQVSQRKKGSFFNFFME